MYAYLALIILPEWISSRRMLFAAGWVEPTARDQNGLAVMNEIWSNRWFGHGHNNTHPLKTRYLLRVSVCLASMRSF